MKRSKLLAVVLASAMVIGSIVGCSSGSSSSSSSDSTTAAATEAAAAAEPVQATTAEATTDDVTIRVAMWDYSNTEYYKNIIAAFEEAYPNIHVEVVEFSADEYNTVIVTQMSGHANFDVVFLKDLPRLAAMINQGHIYALDDLIASDDSFDPANYGGLVEQLTLDGHTYALPFRYDNNLVFYNKDLFDEAGVDYPTDGMTIQEYHEIATAMTSGFGNDKVYGAHAHTWTSNVYMFPRRTEEFNPIDPDSYDSLIPYYNEFLAMQDEGVIQDWGTLKTANLHYSGVFYNQQAAMLQIGTWFINMMMENVDDFNWGVCTLPNDVGMTRENSVGGVTPITIGAYAEHLTEAWLFLTFVAGEEGANILAYNGIIPGFQSDAIAATYDEIADRFPNAPEGLASYIICNNNVIESPLDIHGAEISNVLDEQHSAIMTNSVTVEEGVEQAKERVNDILAE